MAYLVKNVRSWYGMDGVATVCNIYRDTKKVCEYINNGDGAPPILRWVSDDEEKLAMKFAAKLPDAKKYKADGAWEIYVEDLCNEYDRQKEKRKMARMLTTKTLFRVNGENYEDGSWRVLKAPFSPKVKEFLDKKFGVNGYTLYSLEETPA